MVTLLLLAICAGALVVRAEEDVDVKRSRKDFVRHAKHFLLTKGTAAGISNIAGQTTYPLLYQKTNIPTEKFVAEGGEELGAVRQVADLYANAQGNLALAEGALTVMDGISKEPSKGDLRTAQKHLMAAATNSIISSRFKTVTNAAPLLLLSSAYHGLKSLRDVQVDAEPPRAPHVHVKYEPGSGKEAASSATTAVATVAAALVSALVVIL